MTIVHLNNVRGAFMQIFEAKQVNGEGTPAYSSAFLFAPEHPAVKLIKAAEAEVAKAKWGDKAEKILNAIRAADKAALHDGDTKADYDGYAGNMFVNSRSKGRPTIIDRDKTPLTIDDNKPYSGCYVNAQVELWAQDNNYGKRINATLKGIQFVKDGDAFGAGGAASADDFDNLDDKGDDDLIG